MVKKTFLLILLFASLSFAGASAQGLTFSKETFTSGGTTLPYRKADIGGEGEKAALVVYLHGGTSKGNDNEKQIAEPGVDSIGRYLLSRGEKAVSLVPQCPTTKSWIGAMLGVVRQLLKNFTDRGVADEARVYIFGGSMGGTGTWNMLATYPDVFAAAMPVAGNPKGLDAAKVSATPFYTVMGTADVIMSIPAVEEFLLSADENDAEYNFDIEEGWTHEDTCKRSYTGERLDWVFSHVKGEESGIALLPAGAGEAAEPVSETWYDLSGRVCCGRPETAGVYVKRVEHKDGTVSVSKPFAGGSAACGR